MSSRHPFRNIYRLMQYDTGECYIIRPWNMTDVRAKVYPTPEEAKAACPQVIRWMTAPTGADGILAEGIIAGENPVTVSLLEKGMADGTWLMPKNIGDEYADQ